MLTATLAGRPVMIEVYSDGPGCEPEAAEMFSAWGVDDKGRSAAHVLAHDIAADAGASDAERLDLEIALLESLGVVDRYRVIQLAVCPAEDDSLSLAEFAACLAGLDVGRLKLSRTSDGWRARLTGASGCAVEAPSLAKALKILASVVAL